MMVYRGSQGTTRYETQMQKWIMENDPMPHPQDCDCICCRRAGRMRLVPVNSRADDRRVLAERKWAAPMKARTSQKSCDHGLFGDEALQLDLVEMFMEPTND